MLVSVSVLIPDPAIGGGLILNTSRLNRPTSVLKPPAGGEWILDVSTLGPGDRIDRLGPLDSELVWHDLAASASSIACQQGNLAAMPTLPPEPGAATITLLDLDSLDELGIRPGTPLRIAAAGGRGATDQTHREIWRGWVSEWRTEWDKTGSTITTLEAIDLAAKLGAVTRYGAQHTGTETLSSRLDRLATSSPVPVQLVPGVTGSDCAPTVHETDLLAHMHMAAVTCRRFLRIVGTAITALTWPTFGEQAVGPQFAVYPPSTRSFLGVILDSGTPTTVLEATTHLIDTEGNALDVTTTITEPTGYAARGHQSAAVDYTGAPTLAGAIGAWCMPAYDAKPAVRALTVRGADGFNAAYTHNRWIGPLDPINVQVQMGGTLYPALVASVAHTWHIDPAKLGTADPLAHETTYTLVRPPTP